MRSLRFGRIIPVAVIGALLASIAATVSFTSGPVGAVDSGARVVGYTLLTESGGCSLATVDWATGALTDLPAATALDACAEELAISPGGVVYGVRIDALVPTSVPTAVPAGARVPMTIGHLVTYAADGTPTTTLMSLPDTYLFDASMFTILDSIAIDSSDVTFVMVNGLWANVATCAPAINPPAPRSQSIDPSDGMEDFIPCLFTLDRTTGALTLVGTTTLIAENTLGLSIGSDATRTVVANGSSPIGSYPGPASITTTFGTVDRATGAVTTGTGVYDSIANGFYDQLRDDTTVFLLTSDNGDWWTATIDPTTGTVTKIAKIPLADVNSLYPMLAITTMTPTPTTTTTVPDVVVPKITG